MDVPEDLILSIAWHCYLLLRGTGLKAVKVDSTAGKPDVQKGDRCTVLMVRVVTIEDIHLLPN